MNPGPVVGVVVVIVSGISFMIYCTLSERKRRTELSKLAARLGFSFSLRMDAGFGDGWAFVTKVTADHEASNVLRGQYGGHPVMVFDADCKTPSGKNVQHDYSTVLVCIMEETLPQLTIKPESLISKSAQILGFDDISFESAEFSQAFQVRSEDKKFTYDVCNSQMIEYLLANRDLNITIQDSLLILAFDGHLSATLVEFNLRRLLEIRSRLPEYLFTKV